MRVASAAQSPRQHEKHGADEPDASELELSRPYGTPFVCPGAFAGSRQIPEFEVADLHINGIMLVIRAIDAAPNI